MTAGIYCISCHCCVVLLSSLAGAGFCWKDRCSLLDKVTFKDSNSFSRTSSLYTFVYAQVYALVIQMTGHHTLGMIPPPHHQRSWVVTSLDLIELFPGLCRRPCVVFTVLPAERLLQCKNCFVCKQNVLVTNGPMRPEKLFGSSPSDFHQSRRKR